MDGHPIDTDDTTLDKVHNLLIRRKLQQCLYCDAPAHNFCTGCSLAYYCCREHQLSDWVQHRIACHYIKKNPQLLSELSSSVESLLSKTAPRRADSQKPASDEKSGRDAEEGPSDAEDKKHQSSRASKPRDGRKRSSPTSYSHDSTSYSSHPNQHPSSSSSSSSHHHASSQHTSNQHSSSSSSNSSSSSTSSSSSSSSTSSSSSPDVHPLYNAQFKAKYPDAQLREITGIGKDKHSGEIMFLANWLSPYNDLPITALPLLEATPWMRQVLGFFEGLVRLNGERQEQISPADWKNYQLHPKAGYAMGDVVDRVYGIRYKADEVRKVRSPFFLVSWASSNKTWLPTYELYARQPPKALDFYLSRLVIRDPILIAHRSL